MKHDQFTLPFLDTTIVAEGFGLYGGFPTAKSSAHAQINFEPEEAEVLDAPVPTKPSLPAQDYRLAGDRRLAEGWKARAEDNLAAIRLMTTIEAEGRHARPDEQERLAKFTAFGASDLAERIFRRAGDAFAPAWEDLGVELEGLVSHDDLANLKRATQYAHYTPEFMIRAIWRTLRRMGFDGGRVLEPGCGTGLFFALCPEALVGKLALTGVEMDRTTARIAKLLGRARSLPRPGEPRVSAALIYCLALKQYSAGELVVGNSVNSMGFLGSLGAGLTSVLGGEVPQVTQAIHEGRAAALARLTEEASRQGASGVAGVTGELRSFSGSTEFLFVGSCVHSKSPSEGLFTSAGDAQELFCHMDAGYEPVQHVFGMSLIPSVWAAAYSAR